MFYSHFIYDFIFFLAHLPFFPLKKPHFESASCAVREVKVSKM